MRTWLHSVIDAIGGQVPGKIGRLDGVVRLTGAFPRRT
jgi:hypothetical protein